MNLFQIIALAILAVLFVTSLLAGFRKWTSLGGGIAWVGVWLAAGVVVAKPDITFTLAEPLGIKRGADLIVYCSLMAMTVGFFMVYARLRKLRQDITTLTRYISIREADAPSTRS